MTRTITYCDESVLQMMAHNKAILSCCGDSGMRLLVLLVVLVVLQTVDSLDVNVACAICPAPNLPIASFWLIVVWRLHRSDESQGRESGNHIYVSTSN